MFYDKFVSLCQQKGISPSTAAEAAGISRSLVTKWKNNKIKDPSPEVVRKVSSYFNVHVSDLIDSETKKDPLAIQREGVSGLTPEELKVILAYRDASEERRESVRILLQG